MNEYGRPAGRRRDGVCRTGFRSDSGGGRVRRLNPDTLQGIDVIPRRFRGRPRSVSAFSAALSGSGVPGGDAGAERREKRIPESGTEAGRFRPRRPVRTAVRRTFRGPLPPHGPLPPGCGAPCGRKVPLPRPYCRTGPFLPPAAGCPAAYGAGVFPSVRSQSVAKIGLFG